MKKKLLPAILALAVLLIAGLGMNRSINSYGDLTDMALQNVLALADGEDPEDPDPGEDGDGEGIKCLTDQKSKNIEIMCNGSLIIGTAYEFSCVGSGDYCLGASGLEFYCDDETYSFIVVDRSPC